VKKSAFPSSRSPLLQQVTGGVPGRRRSRRWRSMRRLLHLMKIEGPRTDYRLEIDLRRRRYMWNRETPQDEAARPAQISLTTIPTRPADERRSRRMGW